MPILELLHKTLEATVRRASVLLFVILLMFLFFAGWRSAHSVAAAAPETQTRPLLTSAQVKLLFFLMDTDKDGKISRQEWMSFMQAQFDRLDTKKTGELTPNDISQLRWQVDTFSGSGK